LRELTSEEKAVYLTTPYDFSKRPFSGTFDDTTFLLTLNSVWKHVKAIEISGAYNEADDNSTEVIFVVRLSRFNRYFSFFAAGLMFVSLNVFFFLFRDKVKDSVLLTLNGFLIVIWLWALAVNWVTRKVVSRRFKDEFDIQLE
jgi:hypothetical protein